MGKTHFQCIKKTVSNYLTALKKEQHKKKYIRFTLKEGESNNNFATVFAGQKK